VASEGNDELVELDSRALDPSLAVRRVYALGGEPDPGVAIATRCAAPSGIVLSEDESTAHVYCRATFSLATVPLAREDGAEPGAITHRAIASDPLDAQENRGRRLFYNARDPIVSGGLGCAGCHPEGRDDGQVWHEATFTTAAGDNANFVGLPDDVPPEAKKKGVPRRTPLLADRLGGGGPFGWRGESKDLDARLKAGFGLHRWGGIPPHEPANLDARTQLVIGFLRRGLLAPPRDAHEPTAQEQRGRELFNDGRTQCSSCHPLDAGSTTRALVPLPERPTLAGYDREGAVAYKTPSLHHLAGRAPYFHDGSAPSLEELIEKNNDRMGKTNHLDAGDRAALVAFLRSL
jgi:mono/diheme cytochrome c family protein